MECTTLVTFMLQHPTARKLELLGSWDNFSKPYGMERDRRKGRGFWSGCHTFNDIICDGDDEGIHEKRAGGLKMGGTYWYFYRVDDDEEFFDPMQDTTTACPLMPGQTLNVLDVPFDVERFGAHSRSASMVSLLNIVKTLNPDDRYVNPQPASQKEKKHSVEATSAKRHLPVASSQSPERPPSRKRRWTFYLASQRSQQDHARSCAHRAIKSAPASPTPAAVRYFAPIVPSQQATVSSQHALTATRSSEGKIHGGRQWPVRGKSLIDYSEYINDDALEDVLQDEQDAVEYMCGEQWPLPPPARAPPPPPPANDETALPPVSSLPATDNEFNGTNFADHFTFFSDDGGDDQEDHSFLMSGALSVPAMDHEAVTPPITLLPQQAYFESTTHNTIDAHTNTNTNMYKALQALDEQYTLDQSNSPWRSNTQLPQPSVIESTSDAISTFASPIFSSTHEGDHISDTCTSHRLSELHSEWPLKSTFADFDFQLEETKPQDVYSSFDAGHPDVYSSFEHLSIHTTETFSTTSTVLPPIQPRKLSAADENALAELRLSLEKMLPPLDAEQHEMSQTEQLFDEFEYLGAALI